MPASDTSTALRMRFHRLQLRGEGEGTKVFKRKLAAALDLSKHSSPAAQVGSLRPGPQVPTRRRKATPPEPRRQLPAEPSALPDRMRAAVKTPQAQPSKSLLLLLNLQVEMCNVPFAQAVRSEECPIIFGARVTVPRLVRSLLPPFPRRGLLWLCQRLRSWAD